MAAVVLDAHALLVYLEGEPGFELVLDHFNRSLSGAGRLTMTTVNFGEVLYIVRRWSGDEALEEVEAVLRSLPVELAHVDPPLARDAARLKARGGISYADCFAAALALREGAAVLTGDREFRAVEDEVKIEWIG